MKNKTLLCVSAVAAASMLIASPAMAKEFTSADGNITIELPNEKWHEIIDPKAEFVFTNGVDVISANKYEPEDKVEFIRNDEYYNAVLQLSYAYEDQLIILTAQVADAPQLPEVYNAISSIKFSGIASEDDAKKDINNYSISEVDYTSYVNAVDGLNLREDFSVSSEILTVIPYGAAVDVTGVVKFDGENIGWSRVEYDGLTGFVASGNLVDSEDELSESASFEDMKDEVSRYMVMYHADGSEEKIAVMNDGSYYDLSGNKIVGVADGACKMYDGTLIYAFDPTKMSADEWSQGGVAGDYDDTIAPEASGECFDTSGAGREAYIESEYDGGRMIYSRENGLWYDKEGTTYYQDVETGAFISSADGGAWWRRE